MSGGIRVGIGGWTCAPWRDNAAAKERNPAAALALLRLLGRQAAD